MAAPILKCEYPPGNVVHCGLPALTAGASFSFAVSVDVPLDYVDKVTCKIPNTVKITSPIKGDAGDENTDGADDSSTDVAKIDQVIPNPDPAGACVDYPVRPTGAPDREDSRSAGLHESSCSASNAHTM